MTDPNPSENYQLLLRRSLDRRIHNQRARLRWWEELFNDHVHAHWRKAHLFYFEAVRRDRSAIAARARQQALEEAAGIADEHAKSHCSGTGSETEAMRLGSRSIAAAIRSLAKAKEAVPK